MYSAINSIVLSVVRPVSSSAAGAGGHMENLLLAVKRMG